MRWSGRRFWSNLGYVNTLEVGDRMQCVRILQIFQRTSLPSSGLLTGIAFLALLMASTTKLESEARCLQSLLMWMSIAPLLVCWFSFSSYVSLSFIVLKFSAEETSQTQMLQMCFKERRYILVFHLVCHQFLSCSCKRGFIFFGGYCKAPYGKTLRSMVDVQR